MLLPSFTYFERLSTDRPYLRSFIRAFLLPERQNLHKMHSVLPETIREKMVRDEDQDLRRSFDLHKIETPVVLICGHGGRDQRCGVMGPLLQADFMNALERLGFTVPAAQELPVLGAGCKGADRTANVGLISHIGGHKFAGNVIVYLPPRYGLEHGKVEGIHPLAGKGIWYGRVEPRHVEGIVQETIMSGRIIEELFRGGIEADGTVLRIH
ncbi:hypothetical protein EPUS_05266 [Endocarpon pusillum Z07020]|uniref:Altered inheritance of mitochondria protein 32 n=1 Tax=Endocarpon pusillum (strain Z07020 / HMAS-L-300199) TaxID=1263415 RepID=U1HDU3_ENDPU|nr:uncharacterized protein EPUS_05266 [Endocarpon pusillum Z07020]ERF68185.1 hypothetical protein EPUS_05266 [Endocarpon pusillum Z07020]